MRILEIILLVVNVLSLVLCFIKPSRKLWIAVAAVNLTVFMLHGIVDGFRYQLLFSYGFTGLLVLYILFKISTNRFTKKFPKVFKGFVICISVACLALTSLLAYALPVVTLPKPAGSYEVGVKELHLIDEKRNDPFLDKSPQKRELMVKLYYPAEKDNSKPYEPYFQPELITLFSSFFHVPAFLLGHLGLVTTHSKAELQISGQQHSYPVVLFSHGAGTSMVVHTSQYEDLASHGYIVAAIDHPYVSAGTVFPDHTVSAMEATTDFHTAEPAEIITQIMADDISFVMDKLGDLNNSSGTMDVNFKGKFDLDHIGVIGHSVGGAAAYNVAIHDSRVKAAVDLDGAVYTKPEQNDATIAPFLMLANDKYHIERIEKREPLNKGLDEVPSDEQDKLISESMYGSKEAYVEAYNKAKENMIGLTDVLQASGYLYTIKGSDHMKFTDIGLFIGMNKIRNLIGIGGQTDPARCLQITDAVILSFFDQYLNGETEHSLESLVQQYPELQQVTIE